MAYPNLYSDESIVLNAQNVKVKSVSFEAVLTTRRLILVDSKKHLIAPQEILLATLREIEAGENAIRDPTITLSIITNTGATRQMILTFSKQSGGDRHRECDEWVKALKQNMASAGQHPIMPGHAPSDDAYPSGAGEPGRVGMEAANVPSTPSSLKKKIEIARPGPIKKIVDAPPTVPKPVETSSLPSGSFCNKCGSRVPPDSAFCNKCGTPVVTEAEMEARLAAASAPAPAVPQVQVQTPLSYGTGDKKERPIEDVIHSIEPLIEDSVPRTTPYPLVAKQVYHPPQQQASAPEQPAAAPAPEVPAEQSATPGVAWPVLGSAGGPVETQVSIPSPADGAPAGAPAAPAVPPVPPVPPAPGRSKKFLVIGAVALVLVIIIAAVFIFANPLGGGESVTTTPAPTTVTTTTTTQAPSTPAKTYVPTATTTPAATEPATTSSGASSSAGGQLVVPEQNVWIHILYDGEYTGTYGIAGSVSSVADKGEKLLQVPTSDGIVVASIQKVDGSSDKLTVEVFKDGEIVQQRSTVAPKGIVEIQADLKPAATPTPKATATKIPVPTKTAAAANATANATVTTTAAAE